MSDEQEHPATEATEATEAPEAPEAPEAAVATGPTVTADAIEPPVAAAPAEPADVTEPAVVAEPDPVVVEEPGPLVPEAAAGRRRIRLGRIASVAGCVLSAGVVVVGVGGTVVTVRDADRDAGAPVWTLPENKAVEARSAPRTGLSAMLVPYDEGWARGQDLGEFGYDRELGGAQATALRKESLSDLPRSQRKRLEKEIDKQRVKGMAMRSYALTADSSLFTDEPVTVSVVLTQMESKAAVRDIVTFQNSFLEALGAFRDGPVIKGHKNAKCFLTPKDDEEDIDMMTCSAYQGEVLVSVNAEAVKPMNTKAVAALLTDQLDRVEEPGEAV
ncbi:hypothetical protein ABZ092_09385 [Streptomyces bobili]|uniref:hypothetical protein n=1 Tax=Streptomyces bobili TaxID=67280 RepID=UPI0033A9F207